MKPRNGHWTSEATVSLYLSLPKETHFLQVNTKTGVYLHLSFPTPLWALHIALHICPVYVGQVMMTRSRRSWEPEIIATGSPRNKAGGRTIQRLLAGPTRITRPICFADHHQIRWVDSQFLVPNQGRVWMWRGKFAPRQMFYSNYFPPTVLPHKDVWIRGKYGYR